MIKIGANLIFFATNSQELCGHPHTGVIKGRIFLRNMIGPMVIGAIFWSVKKETRLVTSYTGMKAEVVYPALKKGCLNKKGTS